MGRSQIAWGACAAVTALAGFAYAQDAGSVRTGAAAFGAWSDDAPGVTRLIRPSDMPAPFQSPSARNRAEPAQPADGKLKVPDGFAVAPFATRLPGVRIARAAPNGDVFAAQTREGRIAVLRPNEDRSGVARTETFASLGSAFGIAFYPPGDDPQWVYVAAATQVVRFPYKKGDLVASGKPQVIVSGIPGGGHSTRDVAFSPDGRTMYVSIGSQSNVAENMAPQPPSADFERTHGLGATWGPEEWRAAVVAYDSDGKNRRPFANGIRNCVTIAIEPRTATPYCATNERDLLGDNLPPDYVTSVKEGAFYGWPWYYIGDNQDPRHAGKRPDLKGKIAVPEVLIQPHSAPLGMAFNTGKQFPQEWSGDAFVGLHGSWNRSLRTGYKVVRLPFRDGKPTGEYQDFVTGFVRGSGDVWGRPVSPAFLDDGSMIFTDDMGGTIWRVSAARR